MLKRTELKLKIIIQEAPDFFSHDVALLKLQELAKDEHTSNLSAQQFITEIEAGNVYVALLRDDPIGYSIFKNGELIEVFVEYLYRDTELESLLKNL